MPEAFHFFYFRFLNLINLVRIKSWNVRGLLYVKNYIYFLEKILILLFFEHIIIYLGTCFLLFILPIPTSIKFILIGSTYILIFLSNKKKLDYSSYLSFQAPPEEVEQTVYKALDLGYRHIDTAFNYNNEEAIGNAVKKWINDGKGTRQELFITTKVHCIHSNLCRYKCSFKGSM